VNTPINFIGQFGFKSGRDLNKFKDVNYTMGTKIRCDYRLLRLGRQDGGAACRDVIQFKGGVD
jgi:hypothetical protein